MVQRNRRQSALFSHAEKSKLVMKIVIAPDKFKDCLTAAQVAEAIAVGIVSVDPKIEIDLCPIADGGEGTVQALVAATAGEIILRQVTGPLPRMKIEAPIGILGPDGTDNAPRTAVVEMASASGLQLLKPSQRDPLRTTSYGTGELLREAEKLGAKRIILGIGGSASIDGGVGCAQAWGATFTLNSGSVYREGGRRLTGGDLLNLRSITSSLPLETQGIEFIVACDVGNPLLGPDGSAPIFGPQKGATPEQIDQLETGLARLVEKTGRNDLANLPGAGAAGGLGFGMMAFFNAKLQPGIEIVTNAVKLRDRLRSADLCITGEGKIDAQSLAGKTPVGVARICKQLGVPCIALCGMIGDGADAVHREGISAYFTIARGPISLADSIARAPELLATCTEHVLRSHLARRDYTPGPAVYSPRVK
jgi:glycerate kinase